ncbi:hypothetical protein JRQ81_003489 [Phrynocephalus forsythii]|uniref:B box-type domain-containing protein n=1 Tax=Phrynocephalus forsythii TaxID=171643 RepID=A0A9Q1AWZ4_9SAUR|nr:hypothetical protein JRQ81_003489 [Phrynocephalus forsythii]
MMICTPSHFSSVNITQPLALLRKFQERKFPFIKNESAKVSMWYTERETWQRAALSGSCGTRPLVPSAWNASKTPSSLTVGTVSAGLAWTSTARSREAELCCPNCREALPQKQNFRPNRQLANVIEIIKRLEVEKTEEEEEEEGKRGVCERHQEPLKLFCEEDETLICLVCEKSKAHLDHRVVPAEEAFQEYKLRSLEKEKEDLVNQQQAEELLCQNWQKQVGKEKQTVKRSFEKMCAVLKEKEQLRMSELDALEKEIEERLLENSTRLSIEISCLSNLMAEMEEKCQQPETKFLQDIRTMFKEYEKEKVDPVFHQSPWLEEKLRLESWRTSNLEDAMKKCAEILERAMDTEFTKKLGVTRGKYFIE